MKNIFKIILIFFLLLKFENFSFPSEGEHTFSIMPSYFHLFIEKEKDFKGFSIKGRYRYGLSDFWNIILCTSYLKSMGENTSFLIAEGGISYIIDAVQFVPEIFFSFGYFHPFSKFKDKISISAGIGIDYRKWRRYSFGAEIIYYYLGEKFPGLITSGMRGSFYF